MSGDVARVLVVEDDEGLAQLVVEELEGEGHSVRRVSTVDGARATASDWDPDLILTDIRLPGEEGTALISWTQDRPDPPAVIVFTAFGSVRQAVECLKEGAHNFLTKPLDLEHLRVSVDRALETRRLRAEVRRFREELGDDGFHGMLGRSREFQRLVEGIRRVARGAGAVLITGESGVGKELVARALHRESPRSSGPFLAVNCAGIPADLLESEFFGHAEGAFTGATSSRKGLFLEADGGSLLLDEIGEMPMELQAKLLRVLEDGRVRPVGGDHSVPVDVRILASTNRDLAEAMETGHFREDLYFRLQTFQLSVPPLREREGDLPVLVGHFARRAARRLEREPPRLQPEVLERLQDYPFPGNVRELENVLERAVTFCQDGKLTLEHLPEQVRRRAAPGGDAAEPSQEMGSPELAQALRPGAEILPLREVERLYLQWVLERVGGNKRRAAALLGIGRRTLYRRLAEGDEEEEEGTA